VTATMHVCDSVDVVLLSTCYTVEVTATMLVGRLELPRPLSIPRLIAVCLLILGKAVPTNIAMCCFKLAPYGA
jgi:hypothetical protein